MSGDGLKVFLIILGLFLLMGLGVYFNRKKCPSCEKRGAYYLHANKNGERDQRYKVNPLICPHCGYKG